MRTRWSITVLAMAAAVGGLAPQRARAVDGVIEINQARALAGGVSAADTPGFPVTIGTSGSYRLSGNLNTAAIANPTTTNAIQIVTTNVTIDLNGFSITGPGSCSGDPITCAPDGTAKGISASGEQAITIRNGGVSGFPGGAVQTGVRAQVENLHVSGNGGIGIQVDADSIVTGNTSGSNRLNGITTASGCTITNNTADHNGQNGIQSSAGSVATHNAAFDNEGAGITGGEGTLIIANAARNNSNVGLSLGATTGYTQNTLVGNNNNGTQVLGGINLGANVCNTAVCP